MNAWRGTVLALACCLMAACDTLPTREQAVADYVATQKAAARQAREAERFAEALTLWRTLLPLSDQQQEAGQAVAALEQEIAGRVATALERGEAAYASGDLDAAELWMLRVLALQPGQVQALQRLRELASRRAGEQQAAKSYEERMRRAAKEQPPVEKETAPATVAELYASADYEAVVAQAEDDVALLRGESAEWVRLSHVALADRAAQAGDRVLEFEHLRAAMAVRPLKDDPLLARTVALAGALSEEWYRRGSTLMQEDLPAAIEALEKALVFDPDNGPARLRLKKAKVLQRNLEKIRNR